MVSADNLAPRNLAVESMRPETVTLLAAPIRDNVNALATLLLRSSPGASAMGAADA